MYRPFGRRRSVAAAACFESLADSLVTAVRVGTGAAHLYPACGAFTAVLIVDAVLNIALNTVDLVLFHDYTLLFFW